MTGRYRLVLSTMHGNYFGTIFSHRKLNNPSLCSPSRIYDRNASEPVKSFFIINNIVIIGKAENHIRRMQHLIRCLSFVYTSSHLNLPFSFGGYFLWG